MTPTTDLTAPIEKRFWAKVRKTDTCWLWEAGQQGEGYGSFKINGRHIQAHRFSYELLIGPIPEGLELDHLCRIRLCVRPEHLEPVTHQENIRRGAQGIVIRPFCKRGHPLSEAKIRGNGTRVCRPCRNEDQRNTYHQKKAAGWHWKDGRMVAP